MKLSAQQKRRLGLASVFLGVLSSSLLARQYIDDLVVGNLVVCNDLGVGGTAVINQLNCCLTPQGQCAGGGEAEITAQTVSFSELIFTPEDFTPPNCGGSLCDVLSVGTKIFNNLLYECNGRVSSIGLIPLEPDNRVTDLYRIPSIDFKLPLDFITNGLVDLDPDFPLAIAFDVHILIPGTTAAVDPGEVRLELFAEAIPDGQILGGDDCPTVDCIGQRTVLAPDDPCELRHYVIRYCLPAADLYDFAAGPIAETAPWVRVMIDRIDANDGYTGPVYLGLLTFTYPRDFENVLYPDLGNLSGLCNVLNDDPSCQPPAMP